nr:uncharacterized protein LOC107436985 [Parasteatoda tepidariorum]
MIFRRYGPMDIPGNIVNLLQNIKLILPAEALLQFVLHRLIYLFCCCLSVDTRELIDHLHNFLRGLQNRNQVLRPSSTSAFTPVPSSSNSGFHEVTATLDNNHTDDGTHIVSSHLNRDQRPNLVDYETEPRGYPRGSWRHSSSSSKDISPDNSSTDNELWLSVTDDVGHKGFRPTPEHLDGRSSSRSSISPTSPSARYIVEQKRVSEDSTGSGRPIFFASSRRGSKGSNHDPKMDTSPYHQHQVSSGIIDYSNPLSKEQYSRKSSSTHSEESGFIRRDSKSGGSSSWRDSKTDQESSSTSRGEKDSKSSASMEEVLESLLAIPPVSRSSSPTSPRRSKYYVFAHETKRSQTQGSRMPQETIPIQGIQSQLEEKSPEGLSKTKSPSSQSTTIPQIRDPQWTADDARGLENIADDLGKMLDERLKSPPHFPSSSTTASKLLPPFSSPTDEMNHGSFCHSSSTSPLEDDVQSPTSMEVLVPEGEEPELSSIIEGKQQFHTYKLDFENVYFQSQA